MSKRLFYIFNSNRILLALSVKIMKVELKGSDKKVQILF